MLDADDPFFAKPWRRYAIIVLIFGWSIFEFTLGSPTWGACFVALGLYVLWVLFLKPMLDKE